MQLDPLGWFLVGALTTVLINLVLTAAADPKFRLVRSSLLGGDDAETGD